MAYLLIFPHLIFHKIFIFESLVPIFLAHQLHNSFDFVGIDNLLNLVFFQILSKIFFGDELAIEASEKDVLVLGFL
jgi:hypothetical protein